MAFSQAHSKSASQQRNAPWQVNAELPCPAGGASRPKLGLLGGGQLGKLFAQAATRLGYAVVGFWPEPDQPAEGLCSQWIQGDYLDFEALTRFAQCVNAVTLEFENIPVETLTFLSQTTPVKPVTPAPHVLEITQDRLKEKRFLNNLKIATTPFEPIETLEALHQGFSQQRKSILKTTRMGYDGKGQARINDVQTLEAAWHTLSPTLASNSALILEQWQPLKAECAMVGARNAAGDVAFLPLTQTWHANQILAMACWPAAPDIAALAPQAQDIVGTLLKAFDLQGVLCVEFFVTAGGQLLVNELAPRPHNSAHWTIEGCTQSQFELQARAAANLPLVSPLPLGPHAMLNLLGEAYLPPANPALAGPEQWQHAVLSTPAASWHHYGKPEARPGRKMGHITFKTNATPPWEIACACAELQDSPEQNGAAICTQIAHILKHL
ncbi:MAG: 5-(carboxyamino)imidazole ribonucleotide synthase [Vampirovibrionales bacterium]|nr:5-(carboxyamino)imidazole ribonucleotide synthase [Vampirovibrionales bacterium]